MARALLLSVWLLYLSAVGGTPALGKTIVLAAADSIPTAYTENGQQAGILVDLVQEMFKRAGYAVEIRIMPWARCIHAVRTGEIDGIFSVYETAERRAFLAYVDEVLITQVQAFFVRADAKISFDGNLTRLANTRMGIVNATSYGALVDTAIADGTFKSLERVSSTELNIQKLLHHRIDVIPSYRYIALSTAKALGAENDIRELSPPIEAIPSYLAFTNKRDFKKIMSHLGIALKTMKKDGRYDEIFKKYLR